MVINPNEILMELPLFVVLKNGQSVMKSEITEITVPICTTCGKQQRDQHDTFHDGLCNKCWIRSMPKLPPVELECDTMKLNSSMFTNAEYYRNGTLVLLLSRPKPDGTDNKLIYYNVPRDVWTAFITARSCGTYFNKFIKGQYLVQQTGLNETQPEQQTSGD